LFDRSADDFPIIRGLSTRVPEAELERQVLAVFDKMRVEDEGVRDWFRMVLAAQTRDAQADWRAQLQRQESLIVARQDRLLKLRLAEDIDQETFARKHMEMRDRNEKALRRSRRRASFEEKSGRQDTVRTFSEWYQGTRIAVTHH